MTDPLETAKERYFTEVGRQIRAINSAIVVIGLLAMFGILYVAGSMADEHYRKAALDCQEACHVVSR
jgi:hypothetical protein